LCEDYTLRNLKITCNSKVCHANVVGRSVGFQSTVNIVKGVFVQVVSI